MSEPDYLTIRCQFCGGGIEFPSHGISAEIPCPHCAKTVTLLRPWTGEATASLDGNDSSDVRLSRAQSLLLLEFVTPREVSKLTATDYWLSMLGSDPATAVAGFVSAGLVEQVAPTLIWLSRSLPKSELIRLAEQRGLGQSGNRETLAKRLLKADWESMARMFRGKTYLACTRQGNGLVERFRQAEADARRDAELRCLAALKDRRFAEAMTTANRSDSRTATVLALVFEQTPRRQSFAPSALEEIRLAAAMLELTGENNPRRWLPYHDDGGLALEVEARMLLFAALHKVNVAQMRQAGIERVEILPPNDDVCPACRSHKGQLYRIDQVPDVPCEGCTCETGCGCIALAKS